MNGSNGSNGKADETLVKVLTAEYYIDEAMRYVYPRLCLLVLGLTERPLPKPRGQYTLVREFNPPLTDFGPDQLVDLAGIRVRGYGGEPMLEITVQAVGEKRTFIGLMCTLVEPWLEGFFRNDLLPRIERDYFPKSKE